MYSYSRFPIGTSHIKNKDIIIQSELDLSNCAIITDPFGSNKMRFQYKEVFNYKIEKLDKSYKLMITKQDENIEEINRSFFWSDGWNLDATISFFPKFDSEHIFTQEDIIKLIPHNYGNVSLNMNFKFPRVGIVMPLFGRYDYTRICLDSLGQSYLDNCLLILVDESLTKDVDEDKKKTNQFIQEFNILNIPVIKIFKNKHGNMFDSLLCGLDIINNRCEFMMNIDSDTVYKKDWIPKTLEVFDSINNEFTLVTGFNTNHHKTLIDKEKYVVKGDIGGCHMCFRSNIYHTLRKTLISNKWDTNICNVIDRNNGIIVSTKPSVVNHIGRKSSVRTTKKKSDCDKSVDF